METLGKVLIGVLPKIGGSLINGSKGTLSTVAKIIGVPDDPDAVRQAFENDPKAFIKHLESVERMFLDDKKAARKRELGFIKMTGDKDIAMYIVGGIVISLFGVFSIMVLWRGVPENTMTTLLAGALIAKFSDVVSYFFGSSKGSADKNKMLGK